MQLLIRNAIQHTCVLARKNTQIFFSVKYAGELYVQGTYDKHPGFDASATCEWHAMRDGLMAGRKQDSVRLPTPVAVVIAAVGCCHVAHTSVTRRPAFCCYC